MKTSTALLIAALLMTSTTIVQSVHQDVTAINLRAVCQHLDRIEDNLSRLERSQKWSRDTARVLTKLRWEVHDLESTTRKGVDPTPTASKD